MRNAIENPVSNAVEKRSMVILRYSVGLLFFWFGFLKYFGSISPAEDIASKTISLITFDLMTPEISMPFLATLECLIGIGIITKKYMKYVIPVLYFQMAGTLLPLVLFPDETWGSPFVPTLLGQYIIKNSVLISAAIILGAVSKGGKLIADPVAAQKGKQIEEQRENTDA
jgi:uncharacterized membrane protein YphA (DoxX/SURF4 family)